MAKIRGEWRVCNGGWDYCFCVVVERNGKRDESIIYYKLFDASKVMSVPFGMSLATYANASGGLSGASGKMSNHISCRESIDVHYQQIKEAIKKSLENTEIENEIRNYWF